MMNKDALDRLNAKIAKKSIFIKDLKEGIGNVIVGQHELIDKILISVISNGHILLEGVPGLAKTLTINTVANLINAEFKRIQFTPDMLPADLLGTLIYNQKTGNFMTKKGPIFSNIILADEINRAPSKVQSALLEAMQERQITIGEETFKLDLPFLVLATQNPIDQEGTYPLPEAQVDRFMLKVIVDYPSMEEEKEILSRVAKTNIDTKQKSVVNSKTILEAQALINDIYIAPKILDYILNIVFATRNPEQFKLGQLKDMISFGASPRASINLVLAAKAKAFIDGRGYVIPEDVRYIGKDVLRHRMLLSYEAEAEEITSEELIDQLFKEIPVP
jgi:MoxR-like ATPase